MSDEDLKKNIQYGKDKLRIAALKRERRRAGLVLERLQPIMRSMGIDLFGILQSIWAMRLGKFPKNNNPLRRIRGEERIRYEAIELLPKYITEYERIAGKR
jgi:hypothetical protein